MYSSRLWRADNRDSSNLVSLRNIGRMCTNVVLLVSITNVSFCVRLTDLYSLERLYLL